jgi:hypothetical protein
MAGAYRIALSRATVEVLNAEGATIGGHTAVTFSVRDGVAKLRTGAAQVAEMPITGDVERTGRNAYTVTGTDGTVWLVTKPCGCAGGR